MRYSRRELLELRIARRILATGTAGSRLRLRQRRIVEQVAGAGLAAELHLEVQEDWRCCQPTCLGETQTFWRVWDLARDEPAKISKSQEDELFRTSKAAISDALIRDVATTTFGMDCKVVAMMWWNEHRDTVGGRTRKN